MKTLCFLLAWITLRQCLAEVPTPVGPVITPRPTIPTVHKKRKRKAKASLTPAATPVPLSAAAATLDPLVVVPGLPQDARELALTELAKSLNGEKGIKISLIKVIGFSLPDFYARHYHITKEEQLGWKDSFISKVKASGKWKFTRNGATAQAFLKGDYDSLDKQVRLKVSLQDPGGNDIWIDSAIVRDEAKAIVKPVERPADLKPDSGPPLVVSGGTGAGVDLINGRLATDASASARLSFTKLVALHWREFWQGLSPVSVGPLSGKGSGLELGIAYKHFIPQNATFYAGVGETNGPSAMLCWSDWLSLEVDTWSKRGLSVNQVTALSALSIQSNLSVPVQFGNHLVFYLGPGVRFESIDVTANHVPEGSISYGNNAFLLSTGLKLKVWNIGLDTNWSYDLFSTHNSNSTLKLGGFYEWSL